MTSRKNFMIVSILVLLVASIPSSCGQSKSASTIPGLVPAVSQVISGVWEEVGHPVKTGRVLREYSWGKASVVPNWGFIFDLGAPTPYIQTWGEILTITRIRVVNRRRIEIDVRDQSVTGSGAFTKVLFLPDSDGTAVIDFEREDGSLYGAFEYERLYGPGVK